MKLPALLADKLAALLAASLADLPDDCMAAVLSETVAPQAEQRDDRRPLDQAKVN